MKKICEVIRMYEEFRISHRKISKALNFSRPTIHEYVCKYEQSGLTLAEISEMSNSELIKAFEQNNAVKSDHQETLYNLFPEYGKELMKTRIILKLLWEEYHQKYFNGYGFTQFCYHYNKLEGIQSR